MYRCIASFFSHGNSRGNLHVTATLGPIGIIDHEHYDLHKHCDNYNHHDHHNYKHHKHYDNHNYNHHDHKPTFSSVGSGISGMSIPILFGADPYDPLHPDLGDGAAGIYPLGV